MKKVIALLFVLVCVSSAALAECPCKKAAIEKVKAAAAAQSETTTECTCGGMQGGTCTCK